MNARSNGSHCGGHATGCSASANLLATLGLVTCGMTAAQKAAATPMRTSARKREAPASFLILAIVPASSVSWPSARARANTSVPGRVSRSSALCWHDIGRARKQMLAVSARAERWSASPGDVVRCRVELVHTAAPRSPAADGRPSVWVDWLAAQCCGFCTRHSAALS